MAVTGAVESPPQSSKQSRRGLDAAANFFLADVRDGVGPFLAVYLTASHNWNPSDVDIAMSSAAIIVAQLVMIPVALLAGRLAASWRRKPVFLIGFIVLSIRGLLYVFSDNPVYLLAVQALDGIGAGIFGVLALTMIADLTTRTVHFNITRGTIETAVGLGASLSLLLSGIVVATGGYDSAFLMLSGISAVALVIFWTFVPETRVLAQTQAEPEVASGDGPPR